jgi:hypothetical protein
MDFESGGEDRSNSTRLGKEMFESARYEALWGTDDYNVSKINVTGE